MKFLSKHFALNGKEKISSNDSYIQPTWKIPKRILSWQSKFNKFFQSYLLATSNIPYFSTKKEPVIILKMTNFEGKIWPFLTMSKKWRFIFFYNTFAFYVCLEGEIFSVIYRDGIDEVENIFHNIWRTFRMTKNRI